MITRVLGAVIIVLGLIFAGVLRIGQRDLRMHRVPAVGVAAAPLLGVVFGSAGRRASAPTLGVVINLGFNEGTALRGGLLGFVFASGWASVRHRRAGVHQDGPGRRRAAPAPAAGAPDRRRLMVAVGLLLVTGPGTG